MLVVIGTDWIGICKSNYNTIKTAPYWSDILGQKNIYMHVSDRP